MVRTGRGRGARWRFRYGNLVSKHSLNAGLVSWWIKLPKISNGLYFRDIKGKNDGTLTNGPTFGGAMGRPGGFGSVLLDANGEQIDCSISLAPPYTFAFWMRPTAWNGDNPGIWRSVGGIGGEFNIFQGSTGLPWIRDGGANILQPASGYAVPLSEWTRCVFQVSSTASAFSTNGIVRHTGSGGTTAFTISFIGWQAASDQRVTGHFDSLKFVSRYWSESDIAADFRDESQGCPQTINRERTYTVFDVGGGGGGATSRCRYYSLLGVA